MMLAKLHLDVYSAVNMFSAQNKIESAFDRYRLIIVPESLTDLKVLSQQDGGFEYFLLHLQATMIRMALAAEY